ncbi:hypothetical protein G6L88_20350 [Rhizobium skierniewicense]|nr:hypothetical protein [Rhizobium skierniewicense]
MSFRLSERPAEAEIEPYVADVGDSSGNALTDTINGFFNAKVIHRRGPWSNLEAVKFAALEWVDCFNNRHLLEPLGNIAPAEAEGQSYAKLDATAMAA